MSNKDLVHPARFELTTFGSASQRSIQLSYGCITGVIIAVSSIKIYGRLKAIASCFWALVL